MLNFLCGYSYCCYRSQLSVCSEPSNIPIYQSSSETGELPKVPNSSKTIVGKSNEQPVQIKRPTTLILDCNRVETISPSTSSNKNTAEEKTEKTCDDAMTPKTRITKPLFRSNSSSLHKRQSTFVPEVTSTGNSKFKLSCELDQIFVISSNRPSNIDEDYDSIEVIDERRRMKNRGKLYKSNTFICASSEPTNEKNIVE